MPIKNPRTTRLAAETWRRVIGAVLQLANKTRPGPLTGAPALRGNGVYRLERSRQRPLMPIPDLSPARRVTRRGLANFATICGVRFSKAVIADEATTSDGPSISALPLAGRRGERYPRISGGASPRSRGSPH